MSRLVRRGRAMLLVVFACGCEVESPEPALVVPVVSHRLPPSNEGARSGPSKARRMAPSEPLAAKPLAKPPPQRVSVDRTVGPEGALVNGFIIDSLVDVGEAGPAAATKRGVVMIDRSNRLHLARLVARPKSRRPSSTPLLPLPDGAGPFPLARAPAVRGGFAYWVSRGKLFRRRVLAAASPQAPEVLAEDARVGTRVAVPRGPARWERRIGAVAAYIAKATDRGGPLAAKLWQSSVPEPILLTPEGASATSVSLVATKQGLVALTLEGRTGMSTLHLRALKPGSKRSPAWRPDKDRVIWVGGTSGVLSEFLPVEASEQSVQGLMATSRDMTHFGLLNLRVDEAQSPLMPEPQQSWIDYPNGLDPAPVSEVRICGRSMVLLAQPSDRRAHSLQRLLWIPRGLEDSSQVVVMATARSFFDVSVGKTDFGALIVYVSDRRTWARTIRCSR